MKPSSPLSLQRGLRIIELLQAQSELSFSDICSLMQLPNITITRLLSALLELGYIQKNSRGLYLPSAKINPHAEHLSLQDQLRKAALPVLQHMHDTMHNTALLLFWSGKQTVCLERIIHDNSAPLHGPGHIITNHCFTPWGYFVDQPLKWLGIKIKPQNMPAKPLSKKSVNEMITLFEQRSYAFDLLKDRHRIATPIYFQQQIVGILVLGGTTLSLSVSQIPKYGEAMRELAKTCEALMRNPDSKSMV